MNARHVKQCFIQQVGGAAAVLFLVWTAGGAEYVAAQDAQIERLREAISERNDRLHAIEEEITAYQAELQRVGAARNTLEHAINQLELERRKVEADIAYTENRIGATDLAIEKLAIEIDETKRSIVINEEAIGEVLRRIHTLDDDSLIEKLLRHERISAFWEELDALGEVRTTMSREVARLASEKTLLETQHNDTNSQRHYLVTLKDQYNDQSQVLVNNSTEKNQLLSATQNEEARYQALLNERRTARDTILRQLRDFESELQFILDPNTIPAPGTPVFDWPLANIRITQLFGGTEFARQNASVYAGRPYHPGVDFGAPRGTQIHAPLAGVVRAVGNTDRYRGCYSWGKWILIDHANGLSTLYAHLDLISVTAGQRVSTGEVIGYTGNTGWSTGPHLHFTVYVKEAVEVRRFQDIKTVTSCGAATTPVAPTDAYLDPLLYLPPV